MLKDITTVHRSVFAAPCVYRYMLGTELLYIGVSKDIARPFSGKDSNQEQRAQMRGIADHIVIETYESEEEAKQVEEYLIHRFHPLGNRQCLLCAYGKPRRPY